MFGTPPAGGPPARAYMGAFQGLPCRSPGQVLTLSPALARPRGRCGPACIRGSGDSPPEGRYHHHNHPWMLMHEALPCRSPGQVLGLPMHRNPWDCPLPRGPRTGGPRRGARAPAALQCSSSAPRQRVGWGLGTSVPPGPHAPPMGPPRTGCKHPSMREALAAGTHPDRPAPAAVPRPTQAWGSNGQGLRGTQLGDRPRGSATPLLHGPRRPLTTRAPPGQLP